MFFCFWLAKLASRDWGFRLFDAACSCLFTVLTSYTDDEAQKFRQNFSAITQQWSILRDHQKKNWIVGEIKSITLELDEGGSKTE
jgi:hypothetical protein